MIDQYDMRQSECGWQMRDYVQNILEANYDRGYCLDAVDRLPLGGVSKVCEHAHTYAHPRSLWMALSSIR